MPTSNERVVTKLMKPSELKIHPYAQRTLVKSKIEEYLANFQPAMLRTLSAVDYPIKKEDGPWIVDGQHRVVTCWRKPYDQPIRVDIYLDRKTDKEAHELFLNLNNVANMSSFARFVNELGAEHEDAMGVVKILAKHGLKFNSSGSGNKAICSVNALKNTYSLDNGATLSRILAVLTKAFSGRGHLDGKLIEGACILFSLRGEQIKDAEMVRALAHSPLGVVGIIGQGRQDRHNGGNRNSMSKCVAQALLGIYNVKRSSRRVESILD